MMLESQPLLLDVAAISMTRLPEIADEGIHYIYCGGSLAPSDELPVRTVALAKRVQHARRTPDTTQPTNRIRQIADYGTAKIVVNHQRSL